MTRIRSRLGLAIVLAILVMTAGCSATGGGDGGDAAGEPAFDAGGGNGGDAAGAPTATPMATAARAEPVESEDAAAGGGGANRQILIRDRQLIRTGRVQLEVQDFEDARRNLTRTVNRHGGYVSDSSQRRHRIDNQTYTTGMIVLRVPAENFSAVMGQTEAVGTVLESNTDVDDVTEQLVDIEARLKNLRAQRDQLRSLYRRANDTEDVLAVQRRLSDVQEEIERLAARQQTLQRQVAFSTIRVELAEPRPKPEPVETDAWYEVGVVTAFLESVDGAFVTLRALVVTAAYVLPYVLLFGLPVVIVAGVLLFRRRRVSSPDGD